jgi:hypothetical protein
MKGNSDAIENGLASSEGKEVEDEEVSICV